MSFRDLLKFLRKNPDFHPELLLALEKNVGWLLELIDQREEIVHYRAKVMIFTYAPNDLRFAIMKASGKQRVERTADGNRIVTTPVFQFINSQMKGLIAFINDDLIESVDRYVSEHNLPTLPVGVPGPTKISCTGIRLYKSLNNYSQ